MSIDEVTEVLSWADGHGRDSAAIRERQLALAWDRVAHEARQLVGAFRRAGVPTVLAYHSSTGRRRDRVWLPVWPRVEFQPRHTQYLNTADGRAFGTTTVAEAPGIALLL